MVRELSCVEAIEPVTPAARRAGLASQDVLRRAPRSAQGFTTRVRLLNFGMDPDQAKLVDYLARLRRPTSIWPTVSTVQPTL
jgi:hypothetical protein